MPMTSKEFVEACGDQCPSCRQHYSTTGHKGSMRCTARGFEEMYAWAQWECTACFSEWQVVYLMSSYDELTTRVPGEDPDYNPNEGD